MDLGYSHVWWLRRPYCQDGDDIDLEGDNDSQWVTSTGGVIKTFGEVTSSWVSGRFIVNGLVFINFFYINKEERKSTG